VVQRLRGQSVFCGLRKAKHRLCDFGPELNKIIVPVHAVFNEVIPDSTAEYFFELEKLKIDVAPDSQRLLEDYDYLVGTNHIDDENGRSSARVSSLHTND
jgi:hypothetical protein